MEHTHTYLRGEQMYYFLKVLARRETQTASSKIWTWVIVSIFYEDSIYAESANGESRDWKNKAFL